MHHLHASLAEHFWRSTKVPTPQYELQRGPLPGIKRILYPSLALHSQSSNLAATKIIPLFYESPNCLILSNVTAFAARSSHLDNTYCNTSRLQTCLHRNSISRDKSVSWYFTVNQGQNDFTISTITPTNNKPLNEVLFRIWHGRCW